MAGVPYSQEDLNWLVKKINELRKEGLSIKDACELCTGDWEKETGRNVSGLALLSTYNRVIAKKKKKKAIKESDTVIIVARRNDEWAKIYPDVETATKGINGKLDNFEFFRAKPIKLGYKTILVEEE